MKRLMSGWRPRGAVAVTVAIAAAAALAGCSSATAGSANAKRVNDGKSYKFVVLVHGDLSGPFWNVLGNGAQAAGKLYGDNVKLYPSTSTDPVIESQNLQQIVASKPDGIIVTIPDINAMKKSLNLARNAHIPMIIINSGQDVASQYGLAYVGQDEYQAGYQSGQKLAAAGSKNAVCVNQDATNAVISLRCKGLSDAMSAVGGKEKQIAIGVTSETDNTQRVLATVSQDHSIDGIMGTGVFSSDAIVDVFGQQPSLKKQIKAADSFDVDQKTITGIQNGNLISTVDQQQYNQGYLPVMVLDEYLRYGLHPVGNVSTGPNFITKANVNAVVQLQEKGIR